MTKKTAARKAFKNEETTLVPPTALGPVPTAELIERLRAASTLDDAVRVLQPDGRMRKSDSIYEVAVTADQPLPKKRGACLAVYAAAVRLNKPFTVAEVTSELPDVKSAKYWTRRLATTGHLVEKAS